MTDRETEQATHDLREVLTDHPAMADTWVTSDGGYIGIALTTDEAFFLLSLLEANDE